jgi:hypothetical protein
MVMVACKTRGIIQYLRRLAWNLLAVRAPEVVSLWLTHLGQMQKAILPGLVLNSGEGDISKYEFYTREFKAERGEETKVLLTSNYSLQ